ncbi:hypothetical protein [Curtobacterium sp. MCSS17_016]|uniref:hypothetical protein n=1 Tax=Curtobacterium sp. MCSS17_016 TaxID=2175644 RepID=UPI000DA8CEC3|nr:hypothetical protein [Curtobacterium sp. MCSS17_016]WIE80893.1 hypothetical protein DEJ19_020465 [Curtobacterium sp. MCSS17_016]
MRGRSNVHDVTGSDILPLLKDADRGDTHEATPTKAEQFDQAMEHLVGAAEQAPAAVVTVPVAPIEAEPAPVAVRPLAPVTQLKRRAPELARKPGDIVFVYGLRDDARTAAEALQVAYGSIEVVLAGTYRKGVGRHIEDRRESYAARADGVRTSRSFIVAVGLGVSPAVPQHHLAALNEFSPDQVWLAVDVTRKPEDTSAWAHAVATAADGIDALAAVGVAETITPETTDYIGIPVGWADASTTPEAV